MRLSKKSSIRKFNTKGEGRDHSLWKFCTQNFPKSCNAAYVLKYVLSCYMKATGEFVILGWSVPVKAWTQTFPARNYELEHQFRLIINHYAKSQSNIRRERGHVYKSQVVAFDATLVNTTAKENLENTKYKWLGGCFSVSFSSMFWK